MFDTILFSGPLLALVAAFASVATYLLLRRSLANLNGLTANQLRDELARTKSYDDERFRQQREELTNSLVAFQQMLGGQIHEFGGRLDTGLKTIDERTGSIGKKLDEDIRKMGDDAQRNRDGLRATIEAKLDGAAHKQAQDIREFREQLTRSFGDLISRSADSLRIASDHQKERLDNFSGSIAALTEKNERGLEALRATIESRLDAIRNENGTKLEEMRKTVDEKLQSTLEARLGESFNRVVEHLERVHKGIGEMQNLAAGVGDLKRVLTNVRTRGAFGEVQLDGLLDQFLSPEQYLRNAQTKDNSQERVEFAIKFPSRDGSGECLLPVDAKFPHEDYERLLNASEIGDLESIASAARALEATVKNCAKTIRDKYINPPKTLDFGVLFLPTEGLYAEVLRRPGLLEFVQREYHITLTGPTTFTAYLIALQMGFRTLAIEKRSGEVWQVLGAIRGEFEKHNQVVSRIARQLTTAAKSVDDLGKRTRVMNKKLREVEKLPDAQAEELLGLSETSIAGEEDEPEEHLPEEHLIDA